MKTNSMAKRICSLLAVSVCLSVPCAKADIDALTQSGTGFVGFYDGAVGFLFTPSVNLSVTSVQYLDFGSPGNSDPVISFWSGSNSVLASFTLAPGSGSGMMVSSNVSFSLTAGLPYSITLQDGALSSGNLVLFSGSTNGQFQVASQLAGYDSVFVNSNGVFASFGSGNAIFGPNFTFVVVPEPSSISLVVVGLLGWLGIIIHCRK
jgi:hypothetical protein